MEKQKIKKEVIQWGVMLTLIGILVITGWHKPILAGAQKLILATGIMQPNIRQPNVDSNVPSVDMELIDERGNRVNLSDFRGKPVFLNFWATWCPPCIAEMPGIENLFNAVDNTNIQFAMVAIDDDFQKAIAFKKKKNYSFPIFRIAGDIPPELQSDEVPTTYVLDTNGAVKLKHSGMSKYDTAEFISFLTNLLAVKR